MRKHLSQYYSIYFFFFVVVTCFYWPVKYDNLKLCFCKVMSWIFYSWVFLIKVACCWGQWFTIINTQISKHIVGDVMAFSMLFKYWYLFLSIYFSFFKVRMCYIGSDNMAKSSLRNLKNLSCTDHNLNRLNRWKYENTNMNEMDMLPHSESCLDVIIHS